MSTNNKFCSTRYLVFVADRKPGVLMIEVVTCVNVHDYSTKPATRDKTRVSKRL